jgi:hypothetical protein
MKLNLTPCALEGIHELQDNSDLLIGMIEDVENFILDNVDTTCGSDELSRQTVSHVKGLRAVRKLLTQIGQEEGGAS